MKYGGRAVFRGLGISPGMIGKTAYRKILKNIGKEVSFRITPENAFSGKTVKGDIFCIQEHNRAMIITIKFQDGFQKYHWKMVVQWQLDLTHVFTTLMTCQRFWRLIIYKRMKLFTKRNYQANNSALN